jgi:hypothetical protein
MKDTSLNLVMGILMGIAIVCEGVYGQIENLGGSVVRLLVSAYCIRACSNASNLGEVVVWIRNHSNRAYFLLIVYVWALVYLAYLVYQDKLSLSAAAVSYVHAIFVFTACIVFGVWLMSKLRRS